MKLRGAARLLAIALVVAAAGLLYGAAAEFHGVAWGTGAWLGQFSIRWGLAFLLFVVCCVLALAALGWVVWGGKTFNAFSRTLAQVRERLGSVRWAAAAVFMILPIWFLQYSSWGVVFSRPYLRLVMWCLSSLSIAFWITPDRDRAWTWWGIALGGLLPGAAFALAAPLQNVTSYPFSLGWSEGNRLWDYSLLFGKHLYLYSTGQEPAAYLDIGRQFAGGLPFLLPQVSILGERLWLAVVAIVPYLVLGWLAFWSIEGHHDRWWILAGIWGFMFLSQGPIHAPLLLCGILVAVAWRQSTWTAAVLVALAGYFAEISRFTWMFAPAMWAIMLEMGGATLVGGGIHATTWRRSVAFGMGGLLGSAVGILAGFAQAGTGLSTTTAASTKQPLLWYRLFPNATYASGILLGLLFAVGPLLLVLLCVATAKWKLNLLQKCATILPLAAFLAVGLVVSTKIGGGGDLHNMDMFLIGLLFTAALAWRALGASGLVGILRSSGWMRGAFLLLVTIPAYGPLMTLRPISFAQDANWLAVLADVQRPRDLGSLPSESAVSDSLVKLRDNIRDAQARGPVLFMDQRQLLTFGYLSDVQLIQDYEKKRMMDEALSENLAYFQPFYRDLAAHRFSLIISSPLRTPIRDSDYGFGEENNAWVKWVAKPVLCYYQEKDTLTDVKVELLVPQPVSGDCSTPLP